MPDELLLKVLNKAFDEYADEVLDGKIKEVIKEHDEWIVEINKWVGNIPIPLLCYAVRDIESIAYDNPEYIAKIIINWINKEIEAKINLPSGHLICFDAYDIDVFRKEQMLDYLEAMKTHITAKLLAENTYGQ